ncbi:MAG: hypothetical protein PHQ35_08485 [Phycisphaerae bacterium]|nr:hypothetical protein [Phycisphaerae bacterium]MDD5381526.1 hypothetical protein [Phycisphaerae bacterium]
MPISNDLITIAAVNWYSCAYLEKLLNNLLDKAGIPDRLRFVIVDNTNSKDETIEKLKEKFQTVTIIKNDPGSLKGSPAHAHGLNVVMKNIKTPYALILDPDVHILKKNWDVFLTNLINQNNIFTLGVSYPPWKLGMYHNFPNPVFCFFETKRHFEFAPDWSAYDVNKFTIYWDFVRRNFLRLGTYINRRRFENSKFIRMVWPCIEKIVGLCSRDTGWRRAQKAKKSKVKTIIFEAKVVPSEEFKPDDPYSNMAKYFELYYYQNEPILAHKASTNSPVFKTDKSSDKDMWEKCIAQIEKQ